MRGAGRGRLRAIFLTEITTFVGLVPMMFERAMFARFMIPLAISLAFGVLFASVITLLIVPCAYVILEDLSCSPRARGGAAPPSASPRRARSRSTGGATGERHTQRR